MMKVDIPAFIEGRLESMYRGDYEAKGIFRSSVKRGQKFSLSLYKDFRINQAVIIDEQLFRQSENDENWWRVDHTAEAAIEFTEPFFEQFSFLRHKPFRVLVENPRINYLDKREGNSKNFGKIYGRVRVELLDPTIPKSIKPIEKLIEDTPKETVNTPLTPVAERQGCFDRNDRNNGCFGMHDGMTGTCGIYGLTGGSRGLSGCFGTYGNPTGCFNAPTTQQGCFPNLGLGCLFPFLLCLLLAIALFKSCDHLGSLSPVVEAIKKDRDDSRKPPPEWVRNPDEVLPVTPEDNSSNPNQSNVYLANDSLTLQADKAALNGLGKGEVLFKIWDWSVEDKDSVSIIFNNNLIVDRMKITRKPQYIKQKGLRYGENYMEIIATNSMRGANTTAIKTFTDRGVLSDTLLTQSTNQTTRLTLIHQ